MKQWNEMSKQLTMILDLSWVIYIPLEKKGTRMLIGKFELI